jgi:aminoglycoside phosphotransferase (APT) family kinase protein
VHLSPDGWSAITKLEGTDGETRRPPTEAWPALAADVRTALDAVHATPPPPGTPRADLPEPRALLEGARRDAALVGVDVTLLSRCLAPDVSRADEALCHADLKPEHVLVDGRDRLAGIIDWADACVCDPVRDLAGVVLWLGPAFVRLVDAEDAERATFYARCFAVENVARSLRGAWGAPLPLVRAQLEAAFREA